MTRDDQRKIPYACDDKEWVGYDDVLSLPQMIKGRSHMPVMTRNGLVMMMYLVSMRR